MRIENGGWIHGRLESINNDEKKVEASIEHSIDFSMDYVRRYYDTKCTTLARKGTMAIDQ